LDKRPGRLSGGGGWGVGLIAALALALIAASAASGMTLVSAMPSAMSPATYQGLVVGAGSGGVEIDQFDTSSGSVDTFNPSGPDSLTALAFSRATGTAYVAARGSDPDAYMELVPTTVSSTGPVQGTSIPIPNADYPGGSPNVSTYPSAVAVSPNGQSAYVADEFNGVVFPVDELGSVAPTVGTAIPGFYSPTSIAVSPDGSTVYVLDDNGVNVVDPATGAITNTISITGSTSSTPASMALSPDGATAYVTAFTSGAGGYETLYAVTLSSGNVSEVAALPFSGSDGAQTIALSPDGDIAYVEGAPALSSPDQTSAQVAVVDLQTSSLTKTIDLGTATTSTGGEAYGIAITPDGKTVFATESCTVASGGICQNAGSVYPIATATNTAGTPIPVMGTPVAEAITPDQPPVPSFTVTPADPGSATQFDASASTVAYGSITNYAWDFGDGSPVENTSEPTVSHIYTTGGDYSATLTETDSAGNTAVATRTVDIASPPTPTFSASASSLVFGQQQLGSRSAAQTLTVTNTGNAPLILDDVTLGGADVSDFDIVTDGCAGQTLAAGASCSVAVVFTPAAAGAAAATLAVSDDAQGSPQSVALSGTGVIAGVKTITPAGTISVPAAPTNGTGTLYGFADPVGTAITLYRGSSSTPAYEGIDSRVFAYSGAAYVESYGPEGQYEISGIAPGSYKVEGFSFATGAVNSVSEVTIAADQVTRDDVTLSFGSQFTGGLSVTTGFGSQGPLPMAIVGIPFQLNVPIQVPNAPANSLVLETITLSFGPASALSGEDSTATYDALISYNSKDVPRFINAGPAPSPAPTSADGSWELSQAAARFTIGQVLGSHGVAARAASVGDESVFTFDLPPKVADGGTENVSVAVDDSLFPQFLKPLRLQPAECPPGTTPVEHTALDPTQNDVDWGEDEQNAEVKVLQDQLGQIEEKIDQENTLRIEDEHPTEEQSEHPDRERPLVEYPTEEQGTKLEQARDALKEDIRAIHERSPYLTYYECVEKTPPSGSVYVDPSGKVTSTKGVPLPDAKVVLESSTTANGKFTAPANGSTLMSPSNRRNPDFTDPLGLFGWEVQPGYYKAQASAPGCFVGSRRKDRVVSTKAFSVPPPVTGISLQLTCPKLKRTTSKITFSTRRGSQTVTVKVAGHGHGMAYGEVTVKLGARKLTTLPLIDGKALVLVTAKGELTASYSGDGYYASSTAHLKIGWTPAKKSKKT
jgi:DNA-binding beta-propeller fold protein YncE